MQNYDSHLFFQEVEKYNSEISVIPKTTEKYMSFTIEHHKKNDINPERPLAFIDISIF